MRYLLVVAMNYYECSVYVEQIAFSLAKYCQSKHTWLDAACIVACLDDNDDNDDEMRWWDGDDDEDDDDGDSDEDMMMMRYDDVGNGDYDDDGTHIFHPPALLSSSLVKPAWCVNHTVWCA